MTAGYLRIGEFSQRVGVRPELLRAWEKRYGLLDPDRSEGGFRLYGEDDARRVGRMLEHLAGGASAAEAARLALATPPSPPATLGGEALEAAAGRLCDRLEAFDEAGADAVLDELLSTFALETALRDAVLPCLARIGERWAGGETSVGQEHFATQLVRGRLLGLARGWGRGVGPRGLLATPPGELHDLGLVACGLALARQGVRIVFLGADTPIETLASTARSIRPAFVLIAAVDPARLRAAAPDLSHLAVEHRLYLGGAGATDEDADAIGAVRLDDDPIRVAPDLARAAAGRVAT